MAKQISLSIIQIVEMNSITGRNMNMKVRDVEFLLWNFISYQNSSKTALSEPGITRRPSKSQTKIMLFNMVGDIHLV